ncbi:MAG: NUDIX hydrolase [Pseudomonadota bacterium]|jgi:ADP-ribose pyrophosphatase YjhB (NUDIX family)|nr:MAG: ADP-ribose pyrophosphatase [Pseudomonadota bacterium]
MPSEGEPRWLVWSRQLQSIAQAGLTFTSNPYDIERYQMLRELAVEMLAEGTGLPRGQLAPLVRNETGYLTPKIDIRAAVFDASDRLLFVREAADHGRWTLPGGWADVNLTPAENALKEVREESGYEARIVKLAAAWDRARQGHPASLWSCLKMFFVCELAGGAARTSHETTEVAWFGRDEIPDDLSAGRVLRHQVERMFAHRADPTLPVEYD